MFPIYILMIKNDDDKNLAEYLFVTYKNKMYAIAYRVLHNSTEAEDAVSTSFVRIVEIIEKFRNIDCNKTTALIGMIVKGIAIDMYRRKNKITFTELDDTIIGNPHSDDPIDYIIEQESYEKLITSLESLGEDYSNIIMLKIIYKYNDAEIAKLLNITEGNVRVRLHRAKQMMKKQLKKEGATYEEAGLQ